MKNCSRYMLLFGVLGIIQGIGDIELQYRHTKEVIVEESVCSNRTQKQSMPVDSLDPSSYWILQSNRILLSISKLIQEIWANTNSVSQFFDCFSGIQVILEVSDLSHSCLILACTVNKLTKNILASLFNVLLCLNYNKLEVNLTDIKQRNKLTSWRRFLMLLSVELPTNRRRLYFWLNMIIAGLHVPPFVNPSVIPPEAQLFIFLRIITLVKFMRKGFLIYISLQNAILQSI